MVSKESVLVEARKFEADWYSQVTYTWLYAQMKLPKGNKIRVDVKEMYEWLKEELSKEWPALAQEPPNKKRKKMKLQVLVVLRPSLCTLGGNMVTQLFWGQT